MVDIYYLVCGSCSRSLFHHGTDTYNVESLFAISVFIWYNIVFDCSKKRFQCVNSTQNSRNDCDVLLLGVARRTIPVSNCIFYCYYFVLFFFFYRLLVFSCLFPRIPLIHSHREKTRTIELEHAVCAYTYCLSLIEVLRTSIDTWCMCVCVSISFFSLCLPSDVMSIVQKPI